MECGGACGIPEDYPIATPFLGPLLLENVNTEGRVLCSERGTSPAHFLPLHICSVYASGCWGAAEAPRSANGTRSICVPFSHACPQRAFYSEGTGQEFRAYCTHMAPGPPLQPKARWGTLHSGPGETTGEPRALIGKLPGCLPSLKQSMCSVFQSCRVGGCLPLVLTFGKRLKCFLSFFFSLLSHCFKPDLLKSAAWPRERLYVVTSI